MLHELTFKLDQLMQAGQDLLNWFFTTLDLDQETQAGSSAGPGEGQDHDEEENTQPAISRLDWKSNRQKSVS